MDKDVKFVLMAIIENEDGNKSLHQSTLEPEFMQSIQDKNDKIISFSYNGTVPLIEKPVAFLEK